MDVLLRLQGDHPTHVLSYEGNPIVQVNTKAWRNALVRADIHDFRWHDLRHTFATWHREAGTPTHELQRLGWWKTQSMVERYAHIAPEGLQFAGGRIDAVFGQVANGASMNELTQAEITKLAEIFYPYARGQLTDVQQKKSRFVHYTSATVAVSVINNGQMWMRNATTMNDFSEVDYGLGLLVRAYNGEVGKHFKAAIEHVFPGVNAKFEKTFNAMQTSLRWDTYLTCFSRHRDNEDDIGRLSMWRAYGGENGVAIVINADVFALRSNALGAYASPVLYADQSSFDHWFNQVAENIRQEAQSLKALGEENFLTQLLNLCRFGVLCTKHPGFAEEEEWRVIYSLKQPGTKLVRDVELVRGTPQIVYKLPLKDHPAEGLVGLEIPKLLNRIIIGPTENAFATYEALVELLSKAGVADPDSKVFTSQIPLRHK